LLLLNREPGEEQLFGDWRPRYAAQMQTASSPPPVSEWRGGWPVVVAAMVGIGVGPGLFQNLSSLFTPGMTAEFGWTRGQIATGPRGLAWSARSLGLSSVAWRTGSGCAA
jgi:hypothetical protein